MKTYIKTATAVAITAAVTFSATSIYYTSRNLEAATSESNTEKLKLKLDTVNTYLDKNYIK